MKQDKFLTGILIGIGVLIVIALGLFFTRQDKRDYVADDKPEGVVYNYVLAVVNKDYQTSVFGKQLTVNLFFTKNTYQL